MRILFLTQVLPLPLDAGPKIRAYYVLRHLAEAGHEVSLLSFVRADDPPAAVESLRKICRVVETVPMVRSFSADAWNGVRSLVSGRSFLIVRDERVEMRRRVRGIVRVSLFRRGAFRSALDVLVRHAGVQPAKSSRPAQCRVSNPAPPCSEPEEPDQTNDAETRGRQAGAVRDGDLREFRPGCLGLNRRLGGVASSRRQCRHPLGGRPRHSDLHRSLRGPCSLGSKRDDFGSPSSGVCTGRQMPKAYAGSPGKSGRALSAPLPMLFSRLSARRRLAWRLSLQERSILSALRPMSGSILMKRRFSLSRCSQAAE